ncbi:MAG: pre-peptidase C-terminal domain-containing protein [Anaerolineaceae bacterium]
MKLRTIFSLIALVTLLLGTLSTPAQAAPPPPDGSISTQSADTSLTDQMDAWLNEPSVLGESLVTAGPWKIYQTDIAANGVQALVWLAPIDPETGNGLATEPLPILAERRGDDGTFNLAGNWRFTTFTSPEWSTILENMPESLLSNAQKADLTPSSADMGIQSTQTFGGYLLPWKGNLTKYLSQGPNHATCATPSDCYHAWDFYDGTMFELRAAKGGTVYRFKDSCPTMPEGTMDTSCTNYIVLKDVSTTPTTYQIYLHLAHASVPTHLRTLGTAVNQGEVIGTVDNTGFSTGHHLHFMVVTSIACGFYCWGPSVPITFRDVPINWDSATQGGYPCTKSAYLSGYCKQYASSYKSGNAGGIPPTGGLTQPAAGSTISGTALQVGGYTNDERGVTKIQVIANGGSGWTEVGAAQTIDPAQTASSFTTSVNLCAAGISSGPVSLALRIWDNDGNVSEGLPGLRQVLNSAACPANSIPATASVPNSDQVTLFSEPNYQGNYVKLDIAEYLGNELYPVEDNDAASILIGSGVQAVLCGSYGTSGLSDCAETLTANDPWLGDQRVGLNNLSGIKVQARVTGAPEAFNGLAAVNEIDQNARSTDSLLFGWVPSARAASYELLLEKLNADNTTWTTVANPKDLSGPGWSAPSLDAGTYQWQVTAKNSAGSVTSAVQSLTVDAASDPGGTPVSVPYSQNFDTCTNSDPCSWIPDPVVYADADKLQWQLNASHTWQFNDGVDYAHKRVRGGALTSPLITLSGSTNYLRFSSKYQTEGSGRVFDQRRVQILLDGKVYDLYQLSDDPMDEYWVTHTVKIPDSFNGKTVRIRFYFNIAEKYYNGGLTGWYVDNVSVNTDAPAACTPGANSSTASAVALTLNGSQSGALCPGSMDYYQFTASAGQTLTMDVSAKSDGSSLDPVLTLLGSDGSVLSENDDPITGVVQDSQIRFTFTQSGTFFLRLKAYDHPQGSGPYTIRLLNETTVPVTAMIRPKNQGYLGAADLQAVASDNPNGIKYVEFLVHSGDWNSGGWETIGIAQTNTNGVWSITPNPAAAPLNAIPEGKCTTSGACPAVLVRAYDHAGNWGAAAAFDLNVDLTPPVTSLNAATAVGTGVKLDFSASDNLSGLDHLILRYQSGSGSWQQTDLPLSSPSDRSVWWVAPSAGSYNLKIMGVDAAGNMEAEPAASEKTVAVPAASCTPDGNLSPATAQTLASTVSGAFCDTGDVDWYQLSVDSTWDAVALRVSPDGISPVGAHLEVWTGDGSSLLYSADSAALGKTAMLVFPPTGSPLLVRVSALEPGLYGTGVNYTVTASEGAVVRLPVIYR